MSLGQGASSTVTLEFPEGLPGGIGETPEAFVREFRLAAAIEWYREGRVSQGQAAEFAGMDRASFLGELARAKVPACQVDVDELMEEVDRAFEAHRQPSGRPSVPGQLHFTTEGPGPATSLRGRTRSR